MIRLVALYGTGDCYLICALTRAFEKHHGVKATVVVKAAHAFIPQWFGLDFEINDGVVADGESSQWLQDTYGNDIGSGLIYVHPHFVRTPARLDQLTVAPVSQAAMYRALLQISPWTPLAMPVTPVPPAEWANDVIVITASKSWPNLPPEFYNNLVDNLRASGRVVRISNREWTLEQLLTRASGANWFIAPQCGVMSIACEAGFPCRKTIVIKELSAECPYLFGLTQTMPYGHASTFAGSPHPDVRHVIVGADYGAAIEAVLTDAL